ncbi:MAG: hypothetical protein IJM51_08310 [Clostridia bacterium]|nr:hypothetical protein [Clostridia bacterium]
MMNYIFTAMILTAALFGIFSGHEGDVSAAILSSGKDTAELLLTVAGGMVLWSGVMSVAEKSGLTDILTAAVRPFLRFIMPGLKKDSAAERYVCLNITANILGLGNAATPPGIRAMKELAGSGKGSAEKPTDEMVTFAVINTASVQLIPATVMTMRSAAGSSDPAGIMPCVWAASVCALTAGLLICKAMQLRPHLRSDRS